MKEEDRGVTPLYTWNHFKMVDKKSQEFPKRGLSLFPAKIGQKIYFLKKFLKKFW